MEIKEARYDFTLLTDYKGRLFNTCSLDAFKQILVDLHCRFTWQRFSFRVFLRGAPVWSPLPERPDSFLARAFPHRWCVNECSWGFLSAGILAETCWQIVPCAMNCHFTCPSKITEHTGREKTLGLLKAAAAPPNRADRPVRPPRIYCNTFRLHLATDPFPHLLKKYATVSRARSPWELGLSSRVSMKKRKVP